MKVIGLVGGIGSGKSTVALLIGQREGVLVIDADRLGHEVLRQEEVKTLVRTRWGATPFGDDGEIDRRKLASLVFSGTVEGNANLKELTAISHPRIAERLKTQIDIARTNNMRLVLLDAPLLLEGGWERFCDALIFVDAPLPIQMDRVLERGWMPEEFRVRTANQLPLETKRQAAQFVIANDCSLAELEQRVEAFVSEFQAYFGMAAGNEGRAVTA